MSPPELTEQTPSLSFLIWDKPSSRRAQSGVTADLWCVDENKLVIYDYETLMRVCLRYNHPENTEAFLRDLHAGPHTRGT